MAETAVAVASYDEDDPYSAPLDNLPYLLDTAISQWNQRLGRHLAVIGMTFEQWRLLYVMARQGPMNIRELSNAILVPHSTIGRWLAQMEEDGLVKRRVLPRDQRAVEISITPKGRNFFLRALPIARSEHQAAIQELSADEVATFTALLRRLRGNLFNREEA